MDDYFNKRVYEGTYTPIMRFAEFGDLNNYWIGLNYFVNRDYYQLVKQTSLETQLDFNLMNLDNEPIFGDIPAGHLNVLKSRNYVLGTQSIVQEGDFGDLLRVSETYVYAPNKTYTIHKSDIVPVWGVEDTDYATSSPILMGNGAGNIMKNQYFNNAVFAVSNPNVFNTGDYVIFHIDCMFGYWAGAGLLYYLPGAWIESASPTRIVRKYGNKIELDGQFYYQYGGLANSPLYVYPNAHIWRDENFFSILNGGSIHPNHDLTMRPVSGYLMRAYSNRVFKRRVRPTREKIKFSLTEPDTTGFEIFQPKQESGLEFNTISRETVPSPAEWRASVSRGSWFRYAEPEVKFDVENGIYELRIKETKCI